CRRAACERLFPIARRCRRRARDRASSDPGYRPSPSYCDTPSNSARPRREYLQWRPRPPRAARDTTRSPTPSVASTVVWPVWGGCFASANLFALLLQQVCQKCDAAGFRLRRMRREENPFGPVQRGPVLVILCRQISTLGDQKPNDVIRASIRRTLQGCDAHG